MSDEPTPAVPAQAADPATPPAPAATPPTPDPAAPAAPAEPPAVELTPEIQALIDKERADASQKANKEAEALRKRVKAAEDADEARKLAAMSDLEKAQKAAQDAADRATAAEQKAQAATLSAAVQAEATKAGIAPDLAQKLVSGVTFDDNGTPLGVAEAVAALATAHPQLVTPTTPAGHANNPGGRQLPVMSDAQKLAALRSPEAGSAWHEGGGVRRF